MKKFGQKLPTDADFEAALQALPGKYEKEDWYKGGNIFNLLLNGKGNYTGVCDSSGSLSNEAFISYLWSASPYDAYKSDASEGKLDWDLRGNACPLRPLVQ